MKAWQSNVIEAARRDNATRTLMGRYRDLPGINARHFGLRGHAERAAINTPIQGGASDIVMMAMLKVSRNERLQELGWKMILQVHDEIIMEGPLESREEALELIVRCVATLRKRVVRIQRVAAARRRKTCATPLRNHC